jgi:hypothetical protein
VRRFNDANYIGNENGFCNKAKSTRCDHNNATHAEKLELLQIFLLPPLKVMQEVYHTT